MNFYSRIFSIILFFVCALPFMVAPANWQGDLQPIPAAEWNRERTVHLLERAGFGGTQEEVACFAAMSPSWMWTAMWSTQEIFVASMRA